MRLAALWIDILIVWAPATLVATILNQTGVYVQRELLFIVSFAAYSVTLVGWRGRTAGKWLCGLTLRGPRQRRVGYLRAFWREVVGKAFSAGVFFVGFIWAAFSRRGSAWHDYLARTTVVREARPSSQHKVFVLVSLVTLAALVGSKAVSTGLLCRKISRVAVGANAGVPYSGRDASRLVDVSTLGEVDMPGFARWLNENGKDPVDYVVETAAKHQLTILGERHHIREDLDFLNRIIPDLYHKAGVTCIAMEVCIAADNARLERLVTAARFDREEALAIARHAGWPDWGSKGYWDVFQTVWRVNSALPPGRKRLRVVGCDSRLDLASMALAGVGDTTGVGGAAISVGIWERLRLVRLPGQLLQITKRDEIMAANVEQETFKKGEKGIVWVGANHSYIHYRQPAVIAGRLVREIPRMGFMLHEKYGDKVFQIRLHDSHSLYPAIARFIEDVEARRADAPVGFDVGPSPFEFLRDEGSDYQRYQPGVCFADMAPGYVYLSPVKTLHRCQWLEGFISREMFARDKPYFEAVCNREFRDELDANRFYSENAP